MKIRLGRVTKEERRKFDRDTNILVGVVLVSIIFLTITAIVSASLSYGQVSHWTMDLRADDIIFYDKVFSSAEIREIYSMLYSEQLCLRNDLYVLINSTNESSTWYVYDNVC